MARATKKEKVLTPEEMLQQALVPAEEQPYKVPENWCWVKLGNASEIIMGQSPEGSATTDDPSYMPLIGGAADMGELYPKATRYTTVSTKIGKKDDVILCIRATLGRPIYSDGEYCLGRGVAAVRSEILIKEYLRYGLISFEQYLYDRATGTTFAQVSSATLQKMPFPIPPLAEQHRIVSRIESLFAKLDEAKEKAQAVVDGFDDRKAAILTKGILGDLTDTWRQNNGLDRNKWRTVNLSEVCQLQTGIMKGKHFQTETIMMPYLRVANVQDGFLNLQEIKIIEVEKSNFQRYLLQDGDVLFTEGGDYDKLGRGTVWHCEIPDCLHQNHVFVVRPVKDILISEYLSYQAGSQYGKRYFLSCSKQTTNLASINSTQLKQFPTLIPSLAEQKEIVYVIDRYINKEQRAKEAAEQIISQIDIMKKSILARAFRGELGTNDPSDKSAEELLKQIL